MAYITMIPICPANLPIWPNTVAKGRSEMPDGRVIPFTIVDEIKILKNLARVKKSSTCKS
jgi:hypothetical protein